MTKETKKRFSNMESNLQEVIRYMFYNVGVCNDEEINKIDFLKEWYLGYSWTEKTEENYIDWLAEFIKKNWQGLATRKLHSKRERIKFARQFVMNYGFKTRPLKIEDFGMQLVPDGQLKDTMSDREYNAFMEWMTGQTMSIHGIYRYDLERYLNGASAMHF